MNSLHRLARAAGIDPNSISRSGRRVQPPRSLKPHLMRTAGRWKVMSWFYVDPDLVEAARKDIRRRNGDGPATQN